VLKNVIFKTW